MTTTFASGMENHAVCLKHEDGARMEPSVAVAALSAVLKGSELPRPRIRVNDLLSPSHDEYAPQLQLQPLRFSAMMSGNMMKPTVLPSPTPIPVALHRLSKERVKLAPLQPRDIATFATGHHHQSAAITLPRISAATAPLLAKSASTVVLLDDDDRPVHRQPTLPDNQPPKTTKPAKRASDDYKHSHMLAERKRRREMKGVFDQLSSLLPPTGPNNQTKRSKWETLVDTIDYLDSLELRKRALITKIKAALPAPSS